ncbi:MULTISPECIES: acyl-CoA dehydrogenase family protein [unclassified Chelatococcus]|uniref:acyl-CoA dehydrogenase family protein n=1 Tax=unclassified Chelatococcus TaxID=2638111 RepID=UPI0025B8BE4C|nr:acyl-CoA dehydrogenase family protein [Chelatococcus sp.]
MFGVLRAAGNMALSVPLAETMLAGWMLGAAGISLPSGKITFGPSSFSDSLTYDGKTVSGRIARLPFGRECSHAALLATSGEILTVVLVELDKASIQHRDSLADEPADSIFFANTPVVEAAPAPATFTKHTTLLMGSAARAMQIAGALEKILALTSEYAGQRRAFERTISKFQAVQHGIAQLAGEVAVSLSASTSAAEAFETLSAVRGFNDPELILEISSAKIRAAAAAQKGAAIAHQLHGAIGVTREHILHRLTLRALAWRDDYGNEAQWSERLGQLVAARGAQSLWPLLATR